VSSRLVKSSGAAALDADALALIKRAAPLPGPPAETPGCKRQTCNPICRGAKVDDTGLIPP